MLVFLAIPVYFNFTRNSIHQVVPVYVCIVICMLINGQNSFKVAQNCLRLHKIALNCTKSNNAIVKCVIIHLFYNFKNFYFDDLLYKNTTDFTTHTTILLTETRHLGGTIPVKANARKQKRYFRCYV